MLRIWRREETTLYLDDPEGVTRRSSLSAILKELRLDLSFFFNPEVETWRPSFRLLCRDYVVILGFDYFEGVSESSGVSTILKGSKTKLFCLWTDLADLFTQSPVSYTHLTLPTNREV